MSYHNPVLLSQSVDSLEIRDNGIYVDMTYGGGGHSREILKKLGSKGKLIAFDQDLDSQRNIIDDENPENIQGPLSSLSEDQFPDRKFDYAK